MGRFNSLAPLFLLAFLPVACITITRPDEGAPLLPGSGSSIVVGRIRILDPQGEQYPWDSQWLLDRAVIPVHVRPPPMQPPLLALFAVDAGERNLVPQPDAAGMFCWELPPGRYLLYAPANLHGGSERYSEMPAGVTLRVLAALIVSEAIPVGYVGELVLEVEADWILGDDDAQYAVSGLSVQSANVDARRWLARHYPGSNLDIDAPRLIVDPGLSDLLVDYSPERTRDVLDRLMPGSLREEPR